MNGKNNHDSVGTEDDDDNDDTVMYNDDFLPFESVISSTINHTI